MAHKKTDVEKALTKKGFQLRSSHHSIFVYYTQAGKKTSINTKTSHSHREISDDNFSCMATHVHLSKKEWNEFVACTLSRDDYEGLMIKKGKVG